jgi:hypothetical protein
MAVDYPGTEQPAYWAEPSPASPWPERPDEMPEMTAGQTGRRGWKDYKQERQEWKDYTQDTTAYPNASSSGQTTTADPNASSSGASSEPPPPESSGDYKVYPPEKLEFFQKWSAAEWEPWLKSLPDEGPKQFAIQRTKLEWLDWYLACRAHCRNGDPADIESISESWESRGKKKRRLS